MRDPATGAVVSRNRRSLKLLPALEHIHMASIVEAWERYRTVRAAARALDMPKSTFHDHLQVALGRSVQP